MKKIKVCPICGTEMKIDTSAVCTSIPPKYRCVCPSCNCLDFIKTSEYDQYEEEPSLLSNLDEAAEEYFKKYNYIPKGFVIDAFKSGAEWMAGQGISWEDKMTYYDGFLLYGEDERAFTMEEKFNEGDKVIVQIRKK